MSKRRSVSSIFNIEEHLLDYTKMDEILDEPVLVLGYEDKTGKNGAYVVMQVKTIHSDDVLNVTCGGVMVVGLLHACRRSDFPLPLEFYRDGQMIKFKDVEEPTE